MFKGMMEPAAGAKLARPVRDVMRAVRRHAESLRQTGRGRFGVLTGAWRLGQRSDSDIAYSLSAAAAAAGIVAAAAAAATNAAAATL